MTLVTPTLPNRLSLSHIIFMHKICSAETGDFCNFGSSSESQQKDKNLPFSVASKPFFIK